MHDNIYIYKFTKEINIKNVAKLFLLINSILMNLYNKHEIKIESAIKQLVKIEGKYQNMFCKIPFPNTHPKTIELLFC